MNNGNNDVQKKNLEPQSGWPCLMNSTELKGFFFFPQSLIHTPAEFRSGPVLMNGVNE